MCRRPLVMMLAAFTALSTTGRGVAVVASEIICRYCEQEHHQLLPAGVELDGTYQYAPDRQVDVTHIKLDVTPSFGSKTVSGTASITATVLAKPLDVLRLDAVNLAIRDVRCPSQRVRDFAASTTDLQVVFAEPIAPGTSFTLEIDY